MAFSRLVAAAVIAPLVIANAGCTALKPENLWKLNRGTESMNEEAYYSIPPASPVAAPAASVPLHAPSPADFRPAG